MTTTIYRATMGDPGEILGHYLSREARDADVVSLARNGAIVEQVDYDEVDAHGGLTVAVLTDDNGYFVAGPFDSLADAMKHDFTKRDGASVAETWTLDRYVAAVAEQRVRAAVADLAGQIRAELDAPNSTVDLRERIRYELPDVP